MKKFLSWKITLILIVFLAAFLRLYQLGNVPYGSKSDEIVEIYSAYSIWNTGRDVAGQFLPLSFDTHGSQSSTGIYLTAPVVGLFGLNLFTGRLPAALVTLGSVVLLFFLVDYLFKNKWISMISALLFAISPWALQVGRGLWEEDFAGFFYLLGIYIFIKNTKTSKYIWSIIPFVLGFYSYNATKIFFVFLIPILIFIHRKELFKRKNILLIFTSLIFFLVASFTLVMKFQNVTRLSQVFLLNDPKAAKQIEFERQENTAPFILREIFSNKPLYYLRVIRENYLGAFSANFLFLYGEMGEGTHLLNIYNRGELYIIELPLLLFGLYKLFLLKNKFNRNFLLALLLISPLPSAFTIDTNYVDRDYMMLPVLLIIISLGLYYLIQNIIKLRKSLKIIFLSLLIFAYIFLFAEYFYQYYFRWTVYGAEVGWASSRDLVNYVAKNKDKFDNVYVFPNAYISFLFQYATFEKINPMMLQKIWNDNPIKLYNITVLRRRLGECGGDVKDFLPSKSLYVVYVDSVISFDCHYSSTPSAVIIDKGEALHPIWNIYVK